MIYDERDICFILFNDELELILMRESLRSLSAFGITNQVTIVINETDSVDITIVIDYLKNTTHLPKNLRILTLNDILDDREYKKFQSFTSGWITQQYLKLLTYRFSKSKTSIILDPKNIMIRPIKVENMNHNHNFMGDNSNSLVFNDFMELLYQRGLLSSPYELQELGIYRQMTPFIFDNSTLSRMHKSFDVLYYMFNGRVPYVLPSEILLYYAFIAGNGKIKNDADKERYLNISYTVPFPATQTLKGSFGEVKTKLDTLANTTTNILQINLHRGTLLQFNTEERNFIIERIREIVDFNSDL